MLGHELIEQPSFIQSITNIQSVEYLDLKYNLKFKKRINYFDTYSRGKCLCWQKSGRSNYDRWNVAK